MVCTGSFQSSRGENIPTPSQVDLYMQTSLDVLRPVEEMKLTQILPPFFS